MKEFGSLLTLVALQAAGCTAPSPAATCATSADCPVGYSCYEVVHFCVQDTDAARIEGGARDQHFDGRGDDAAVADVRQSDARHDDHAAQDAFRIDGRSSDRVVLDAHQIDAVLADVQRIDVELTDARPVDHSRADAAVADAIYDHVIPTNATDIYRSVGPGNTTALAVGTPSNTLRFESGLAVFDLEVPPAIGVGDVIAYDSDSDATIDTLAMIVGRASSTSVSVRPIDGAATTDPGVATLDWRIYRAYTSLANALAGRPINSGLTLTSAGFQTYGDDQDLVRYNQRRHIACYADAVDTSWANIQYWTTSPSNYLRIYAPYLPGEVGVSQRHNGTWRTSGAYTIDNTSNDVAIVVRSDNVWIDGLQVSVYRNGGSNGGISVTGNSTNDPVVTVSECIIRGNNTGLGSEHFGIEIWDTQATAVVKVHNNLIYGFTGSAVDEVGIWAQTGQIEGVNNTLVGCFFGARVAGGAMLAVNNLFSSCTIAVAGTFADGTDYNATDSLTLSYNVQGVSPTHDHVGSVFTFLYAANKDFHLGANDQGARELGREWPGVVIDIDGNLRPLPTGTAWDIGADEAL